MACKCDVLEVEIRPNAPAWTNSYTRLLQRRKKQTNYTLYKKANAKYLKAQANVSVSTEILTKLFNKKSLAYDKYHESRNNSTNANRRANKAF